MPRHKGTKKHSKTHPDRRTRKGWYNGFNSLRRGLEMSYR